MLPESHVHNLSQMNPGIVTFEYVLAMMSGKKKFR